MGVLVGGLATATLLTTAGGLWHHQYELDHQVTSKSAENTKPHQTDSAQHSPGISGQATLGQTSDESRPTNPRSNPKPASPPASHAQPVVPNNPPGATNQNQTVIAVALSVNGSTKGKVSIPAGSNHCDVLTQAFKNRQISSLDMRHSPQYGTQAVYMIDGIGDSGAVWWTYTVNGNSPPYGCSHQVAKNGDVVNWQYVKG